MARPAGPIAWPETDERRVTVVSRPERGPHTPSERTGVFVSSTDREPENPKIRGLQNLRYTACRPETVEIDGEHSPIAIRRRESPLFFEYNIITTKIPGKI